LAERVRDVGGQVVVSAQSYEGLGADVDERRRMRGALAGGMILHRCIDPDELVQIAGTVRATEQSWQLDSYGQSGMGSVSVHHKMKVDPDAVRQARTGEAWVVTQGRALHMSVLRTDIDDEIRRRANRLVRRAYAQAAADLAAGQAPTPQPWWELELPQRSSLELEVPPLLGLPAGEEPVPVLGPPTVPPPSEPDLRLLLAIAAAVRAGQRRRAEQLADQAADQAPGWDRRAYLIGLLREQAAAQDAAGQRRPRRSGSSSG
jgi:hypothetical protein